MLMSKLNSPFDFVGIFFFQAEDGIRDLTVTGVQTCALPIYCEEIAGPIGEVNGVSVHCGSSRNIATRCEHPFRFQLFDIGRADGVLSGLAPSIAQILSGYSPLARLGLR